MARGSPKIEGIETMNDYQPLKAADLKVGQDVVVVSNRYSNTTFLADKVARVTKTTVTLESGKVFNVWREGGWTSYLDVGNVKRGERKTKDNQWPDEYARLVAVDDPHLAVVKEQEERYLRGQMSRNAARAAAATAYNSLTRENAEAAVKALQAWLETVEG